MSVKYIFKVLKNCFGNDIDENPKNIECCICLGEYCYSAITELKPCFHNLCHDCFDEYLNYGFSSCPLCLEKLTNIPRFKNIPIISNISKRLKRMSIFSANVEFQRQHLFHLKISRNISKYINKNNLIECYDTRMTKRNKFVSAIDLEEHIKQSIYHRILNIEDYSSL